MSAEGDARKRLAAQAALKYVAGGAVIGVGTGSTVNALIDQLGPWKSRLRGAVSSSEGSGAYTAMRGTFSRTESCSSALSQDVRPWASSSR